MTTAVTLLNQLAELWPMIDRDDPALVEAEAAFAAAVAKVMREADPAAERMMLGTAEACDGLAEDPRPPMSAPPVSE